MQLYTTLGEMKLQNVTERNIVEVSEQKWSLFNTIKNTSKIFPCQINKPLLPVANMQDKRTQLKISSTLFSLSLVMLKLDSKSNLPSKLSKTSISDSWKTQRKHLKGIGT